MAFLHERQIVHRDFKSLNLLVTKDYRIKICDFGLSRLVSNRITQQETFYKICGTFSYCAPAMYSGFAVTFKSDVYSYGIVLWEILFVALNNKYEHPYEIYDFAYEFLALVQSSEGLRPQIHCNTPSGMVEIFKNCVDGEPEKRPSFIEISQSFNVLKEQYTNNRDQYFTPYPDFKKWNKKMEKIFRAHSLDRSNDEMLNQKRRSPS